MAPERPVDDGTDADAAVAEALETLEAAYPSVAFDRASPGVDALAGALSSEDPDLARDAARLLAMLAEQFPDVVAGTVAPLVAALDADDERVRRHALRALGFVSRERAAAVRTAVDRLLEALDGTTSDVRKATWVLANVARDEPAAVEPAVDRLVALLEFGDEEVHRHAAAAVGALAEAAPDGTRPAVPRLLDLLQRNALYRAVGRSLVALAGVHGEAVVEGLFERLTPGRPVLREHAAWTLVELADSSPATLWDRWPALVALVRDDEDYQVKNSAAATLAALAAHRPDDDLLEAVAALAEHDDPFVRRFGCLALGDVAMATGDAVVVRALDRARDDRVEAIGELAETRLVEVGRAHPGVVEAVCPELLDAGS